jgi:site-specific recombinase XerD
VPKQKGKSQNSIDIVVNSVRYSEDVIGRNPFERIKIPRPLRKVILTFSEHQIQQLLNAIDIEGVS